MLELQRRLLTSRFSLLCAAFSNSLRRRFSNLTITYGAYYNPPARSRLTKQVPRPKPDLNGSLPLPTVTQG